MKMFQRSLMALLCGAFLSLLLAGCNGAPDVKQDPGTGGKGLTDQEKKDKKATQ
ncbi:MAG: hypothetical protein JWL77_6010 [Chthonomonadaceae bacterium]|nr:hypothetical protein [Chthonomonadaceae bacterium]